MLMRKGIVPYSRENEYCFSELYDSGGADLMSTIEDYFRLLSMLSMGGTAVQQKMVK